MVPRSEAEALAEALEAIRSATAIEDSGDVDPLTQYRQVKRAESIATETLAAYRSRHPKETS
jgi:hypothetical protein